jgi:hypothetical protein
MFSVDAIERMRVKEECLIVTIQPVWYRIYRDRSVFRRCFAKNDEKNAGVLDGYVEYFF